MPIWSHLLAHHSAHTCSSSYVPYCSEQNYFKFSQSRNFRVIHFFLHVHPKHWVSSVQFSCSVMSNSLQPHGLQHTRPPCSSPTPGVYSNSCPLGQWCHPTIPSSAVPFSFCFQSIPAPGSFPMSQFFSSGGQSIGVSASTAVLLMNTQDCSALGWTGWISLQSEGLSRIFSGNTVQKYQSSMLSFLYGPTVTSRSNS